MLLNKLHIDNTKAYGKSQQPLVWMQVLNTKQYTSALYCVNTQSIVYLRELNTVINLTKDSLLAEKNNLAKYNLTRTAIAVNEQKFTLLPNQITEPQAQLKALNILHDVMPTDAVKADALAWQKMQVAYVIKNETMALLESLHENVSISNIHSSVLYQTLNAKYKTTNCVFINSTQDAVSIAAYKNNELQVYNSYTSSAPTDILYYVAKAINTLNLTDPTIYVCGADADNNMSELAKTYAKVTMAEMPTGILNTDLDAHITQHFYNLYCFINQCA